MLKIIPILVLILLFEPLSGQKLLDKLRGDVIESYDWMLQAASSKSCKTGTPITEEDIEDTDVKLCQFIDHFEMFPNPTDGYVTIDLKGQAKPLQIVIMSLDGKPIYQKKIPEFEGQYSEQIDLSSYPKGVYLVSILQNKAVFNRKLVYK